MPKRDTIPWVTKFGGEFCEIFVINLLTIVVTIFLANITNTPPPNNHTSYLSFLLHRQECSFHFCSTQKCVNCDKTNITSKQGKSWKDCLQFWMWIDPNNKCRAIFHCLTWSNCSTWQAILSCGVKLIVMWSNFDPHDKQNCHVEQNCSTWFFCSTDNVCSVWDNYDANFKPYAKYNIQGQRQ